MSAQSPQAHVLAVSLDSQHRFSKRPAGSITLLTGLGVQGDAHLGVTVQHRSRVKADPTQPNLRQVHLMHAELFDELRGQGFEVMSGQLGENITTLGLDVLALPVGTLLDVGERAQIELTGLRNPCLQIEAFAPGLLAAVLDKDARGGLIRKAGVMGVVRRGGVVRPGDRILVTLPPTPHRALERV